MPIPAPHVFGVAVHGDFDAEHSATQNMKPSIPLVFPAPCGCTVWTNEPVAFSREWAPIVAFRQHMSSSYRVQAAGELCRS